MPVFSDMPNGLHLRTTPGFLSQTRERRKVVAVEEMRTYDHQSSKLNRNMHRGNEVIDNASLLSKEGSRSVTHGKVIEVQTG